MSAALIDASAATSDDSLIWQLAFWPPDIPITLVEDRHQYRHRHLRLVVSQALAVAHVAPIVLVEPAVAPGTFPCTWPGCSRGYANPFESGTRLANHRFAAHGLRSSNEESIARQARRDRQRAIIKGTPAPEYIDIDVIQSGVKEFLPINLPSDVRDGALDAGEREHLRRRLCFHILQWMREFRRSPAHLAVSVAQIAAAGLKPTGLAARVLDPEKALENGPRARLQAVARGRRR